MRVSLFNLNLIAKDAIGSSIIAQARFFLRRGDTVQIFVEQSPEGVPVDIAQLCHTVSLAELRRDREGLFAATDVYIYHYGGRHSLMETITGADGGLVIFHYHNVTPPALWNREDERQMLRRGVEGVVLAADADLVLSDSAYSLADLAARIALPPARLVTLPLPVDVQAFRPGAVSEDLRYTYGLGDGPVLLYVGRMAPNKRIDLLVELLAAVKRHPVHPQPEAALLLVGDADSSPAYRLETDRALQKARFLAVENHIVIAGRVGRLPDHYRLASAYVTASQHEGFCVPLIEAMASGVPIVAAANTAIPETLGDAGLLAPVDSEGVVSVEAMADAVVRILSEPDLADDLRQRGLTRAVDFSGERFDERMEAIISEHCTNLPLRLQPTPGIQMSSSTSRMEQSGAHTGPMTDGTYDRLSWSELTADARVSNPDYTVRSRLPVIGRLIVWVRRNLTSHLKEPYLDPMIARQEAFNLEMTRRFVQLDQRTRYEQDRTHAALLRAESQIAHLEGQAVEAHQRKTSSSDTAQADMDFLEGAPQRAYAVNYLRCNEAVGGDLEIEMALYEPFVSLFRGHAGTVVDLGCGRGVFLKLMQRHGIPAAGADVDGNMVAYCREQGLIAEEADVFAYLQGMEDASLGGIFCAHVVEHLPRTRLMELADLCWRKLEEGAAVVWITPHGGSLAPLHSTFYKDLTHTRPLHPDLLAFILEANGFRQVEIRTLSDMPEDLKLHLLPSEEDQVSQVLNQNFGRLNDLLFGHLDCAAIGWR